MIVGPPPAAVQAWLASRRRLGLDRHDEVWEGAYHVAPAPHERHGLVAADLLAVLRPYARARGLRVIAEFNLGEGPADYRVPDGGLIREPLGGTFVPAAVAVVEVLSPEDETFAKFGFYASRGVGEVLVADPARRQVTVFQRAGDGYQPVATSPALGTPAAELTEAVDWP